MIQSSPTTTSTSTFNTTTAMVAATVASAADSSLERKLTILRRADLFSALADPVLRRLAGTLTERAYTGGATIMRAEEPGNGHFYIVAEGEVAVVLQTADGKETVLATLLPGEFFGEMSILDEAPRAATARAVKAARVMVLRREDFKRYLHECPDLAYALLTEMNRRLRQSNRKVAGLSYQSMQARVAAMLMRLTEDRGVRQKEAGLIRVLIRNRPTQQFLAEMAGTTRESVSRTLAAWGRQGLVRARGCDLFILEEEQIKAMAS
jgi:CRP/FNR family transcriptional regulator, cyclic AMP receptor protein